MNDLMKHLSVLALAMLLCACGSREAPQAVAPGDESPAEEVAPAEPAATEPVAEVPEEGMVVSAGVAKAGTDTGDPNLELVDQASVAVGAHVEITTKAGSVRRGTVIKSSTYETQLMLDEDEGGFQLNMPGDSIAQVRIIHEPGDSAAAAAQ